MATVAELMIKLGMDDSGLDKGMGSSQSKLQSWGANLRSAGTKLTAGVTLPLAGAAAMTIKWASDLEESGNKVDVVFGDSAKSVREWAQSTSGSLLMSTSDAQEAAGTFGNLFTSMGMGQEEAAGLSTDLVELGQDLSSFNNIPTDQALIALRAALVGEYEPMRALGVQLSQATVEQKALEMGIWDGNGALTAQQRVLATNALIMEQTTNAQGDAARTSKSFANQMRILRSNLEDVGAEMGKRLLPYVNRFLAWAIDMLDAFGRLDSKWQTVIMAIAGIAAALGPLLLMISFLIPAFGVLATVIGFLISPIGLLVIAIAALIGLGIYAFINDLWGVRDAVFAVVDALRVFEPMLGDLMDVFQAAREGDWGEVFDELKDAAISLGQALFELQGIIGQALAGVFQQLFDWVVGYDWYGLLSTVGQAISDGLMAGMQALSDAIMPTLQEWANGILLVFTTMKESVLSAISEFVIGATLSFLNLWLSITSTVTEIKNAIVLWFTNAKTEASALVSALATGVKEEFVSLWINVKSTAGQIYTAIKTEFENAKNRAVELVNSLASAVGLQFINLWTSITGTMAIIKSAVVDAFTSMADSAVAQVFFMAANIISEVVSMGSSLATEGFNAGASLADGIGNGIASLYDWAVGQATSLANAVIGAFTGIFKPGSPSKVTTYYGKMLAAGLVVGMDSMEDRIIAASDRMAAAALQPIGDMSVGGDAAFGGGMYGAATGNTYVSVSLKSQELVDLIRNAEDGGEFARNFGPNVGLYAGMP